MSNEEYTITTGILPNVSLVPGQFAVEAAVAVQNVDADESRYVQVEVFDWSDNVPVALTVVGFNGPNGTPVGGGPVKIQANTACAFFADVSDAFVYEVRVTFHGTSEDVVVNTFGLNSDQATVEGTTVLYKDFKHVDMD